MNTINAVQLFVVVWTFTTVCQADDDLCSVTCQNVTGSVGKEATFSCRVSQKCIECCIVKYKFQYPDKDSTTVCKQDLPEGSCEQRNSFTCTPTTAITGQFRFFMQTRCGVKKTLFTVNITEEPTWDVSETFEQKKSEGRGFKIAVIAAVISSLIIIIMPIIYRMTQKHPRQKRTFQVCRHDEDNSNPPENVI